MQLKFILEDVWVHSYFLHIFLLCSLLKGVEAVLDVNRKTLWRIFLGVSGCIILYWLLHETERVEHFFGFITDLLAPFVVGGVLAFILNVPMRAFESSLLKKIANKNVKRVLSVILTFIAMILVLALVFWLLIPQIIDTVNSLLPSLRSFLVRAEKFIYTSLEDNPQLLDWFKSNTEMGTGSLENIIERILKTVGSSVTTIVGGAVSVIGVVFNGVFNAVISIVFAIYCLFQKETLSRQGRKLLYAFLKERTADRVIRVLRLTNATFSNFLSGQCVEVCILGAMFAVCMAIFGMPYIPLISVLIAVTAFIPIVGAWTGCVLGAFLILVKDPILAFWFVVMFLAIQQIENNMIYPRVVGTSVGLSGMWVLIAVSVGGELMGVVGMFLMIPLVSVVYTLLTEHTNKKLSTMAISDEKLRPQPPEINSKFKEKREVNKKKRKEKRDLLNKIPFKHKDKQE